MSRRSSTYHQLVSATINTVYSDERRDGRVSRSRSVDVKVGALEVSFDSWPKWWKNPVKYARYGINVDWYPFEPEDSENMHEEWKRDRR